MRTMERAAFYSALAQPRSCHGRVRLHHRALRQRRLAPVGGDPERRRLAYGGYPDVDALYKQQAAETDRKKREAMLHQIQQMVYERVRFGSDLRVHLGRAGWARAWRSRR